MKRNTCGLDRLARFVGAAVLAAYALRGARDPPGRVSPQTVVATYAAAELAVTGLTQWCPLNAALGRNTCRQRRRRRSRAGSDRSRAGTRRSGSGWLSSVRRALVRGDPVVTDRSPALATDE